MNDLYVVIFGNPFDGFNIIGPFNNEKDAVQFIDDNPECDHDASWITILMPPVKKVVRDEHQSCH